MSTHPTMRVALAAFALMAALVALWVATGSPLHWTKGVVLPGSCTRVAEAHACLVELVPDGTHVTAKSDAPLVGGRWVELRVWHDIESAIAKAGGPNPSQSPASQS